MARPLPLEHVAVEPFFQALLTMKQVRGQQFGALLPPRPFAQAVIEVFAARQRQQALDLKGQSLPLDSVQKVCYAE